MTLPATSSGFVPSPLARFGLRVQKFTSPKSGPRHFHIATADKQSSLVLAIPVSLEDNSGVAHVLEHLLLTGSSSPGVDSLFFSVRAASSAVDMNAVTNSQYLAVHFTCENEAEYLALLDCFSAALFRPNWSSEQRKSETGDAEVPGIITNEMAGVFADRRTRLAIRTHAALFASGSKQFNSGGDPDLIHTVNQSALDALWSRFFRPENLIVISTGAISAGTVRAQLDTIMPAFNNDGVSEPVVPSKAIWSLRQKSKTAKGVKESSVSLGLLLQQDESCRCGFEPLLLGMLLKRHADQVIESGSIYGFDYIVVPEVRQLDGDYFLFAAMPANTVPQQHLIADCLAKSLEQVLLLLSSDALTGICEEAICVYLSLGNWKTGAGVAASLEFLDYFCRGEVASDSQNNYDETFPISEILSEFRDAEAWRVLIERYIRNNPRLALFHENVEGPGENYRPVQTQGLASQTVTKQSATRTDTRNLPVFASNAEMSLVSPEPGPLPVIYNSGDTTLFHYQLPRPWLATSKVVLPLSAKIFERAGAAVFSGIATEIIRQFKRTFPETTAGIDVMRCRGGSGFLGWVTLSLSGSETKTVRVLQSVVNTAALSLPVEPLTRSKSRDGHIGVKQPLPPHKQAIYLSAKRLSRIASMRLALHGCLTGESAASFASDKPENISLHRARILLCTENVFPEGLTEVGFTPNQVMPAGMDVAQRGRDQETATDPAMTLIPGEVNHCARSWLLPESFGQSPHDDVVPYLFATLATSVYLEPVLRGEHHAYAASADIDAELGVLAMFSFRDPLYRETDDFFFHVFDSVHKASFDKDIFLAARRRTLSRLQDKGSIDQRCERQFDRWLAGYDPEYQIQLSQAVIAITPEQFKDRLTGYFDSSETSGYALVGKDNQYAP